jgi:hypothetical protein
MRTCENCGIPEGSYSNPGQSMTLNFRTPASESPGFGKKRDQRRTVWVCTASCALQTMAIAAMGLPTHKWPMTYREFVSQLKTSGRLPEIALRSGQTVTKTPSETRINTGDEEADFPKMILGHREVVFVTKKGGRPRIDHPLSEAERARRCRDSKRHRGLQ